MKRFLPFLLLSVLAAALLATGCQDTVTDGASSNQFTINGDNTYTNALVTGDGVASVATTGNITISGLLNGKQAGIILTFDGTSDGTYTWGTAATATIMIDNNVTYQGTSGQTVVTSVGESGGKVVGTFQGTLANVSNPSGSVTVNGSFNATRN